MASISSLDGLVAFVLVFISSSTLLKRVKSCNNVFNHSTFGIFRKSLVIGTRLTLLVQLVSIIVAVYTLLK